MRRAIRLLAAACLGVIAPTACRQAHSGATGGDGRRAQALLASASEHEISMFGDLPGAPEARYFTRSATSLRQHTFPDVGSDFDVDVDAAGERMVFASTRHNLHPDLYIQAVDGAAVTQLTSDPASDIQPAFSPDDGRVAFASNRSGNWDIWIAPVSGGPAVQVTNGAGDEIHPSWSPDGAQVVYCSLPETGGQWELWIADAAAGGSRRFIGYGLFPEWSPRGDAIVFQRARERGGRWFSVWTLTLVRGEPRYPTELASSPNQAMITPTWRRDGGAVAFASAPFAADDAAGRGSGAQRPIGLDRPGSATAKGGASRSVDLWVVNADGTGKYLLTDGHTRNHGPIFGPDGRLFFSSDRAGGESVWSLIPESSLGSGEGAQNASDSGREGPAKPSGNGDETGAARVVKDDL